MLALAALGIISKSVGVELGSDSKIARALKHPAFQILHRPIPPSVADLTSAANPIDLFVLGRLEKSGLKLGSEADRSTLLRRVAFAVTGLPPTPEEIDAFV